MTTLFLGTPLLSYDGTRPFVFSKTGFPLSRNFYVRACIKFTRVNKIGAMYERSRVNVKLEPRPTFKF